MRVPLSIPLALLVTPWPYDRCRRSNHAGSCTVKAIVNQLAVECACACLQGESLASPSLRPITTANVVKYETCNSCRRATACSILQSRQSIEAALPPLIAAVECFTHCGGARMTAGRAPPQPDPHAPVSIACLSPTSGSTAVCDVRRWSVGIRISRASSVATRRRQ